MNPSASRAASRVRARLNRSLLEGASRIALALALLPALDGMATAASPPVLPQNGAFKAGTPGAVPFDSSVAGQLTVNQASQRAIIEWQSFSIGAGGKVQINNGSGATLNRVTGGNLSSIMGDLRGTGSVYLINPQGVVIGQGGTVITGGRFVASTLDVDNNGFMAGGDLTFSGTSTASVQNSGSITSTGSDVVLIARTIGNDGSISAANGTAGLAAGTQVLLRETTGSEKVFVQAPGGDINNSGTIAAAQVELKAAGGNIYALAGNNGGAIRATGTQTIDGHVWLTADGGGSIYNDGAISAQNADGSGGAIALAAAQGTVSSTGNVSASGTAGGSVTVTADRVIQQGTLTADASSGNGGQIATNFTSSYIDTEFALTSAGGNSAGSISVTGLPAVPGSGLAGGSFYSSGTFRANGYLGGSIALTASSMHFAAAQLSASGSFGGGSIRIGGDFHGGGTLPLAGDVYVNPTTALMADATVSGNGGSVVVWSQNSTTFGGMSSAVGGPEGGQGGQREISSANTLTYDGRESTSVGDKGSLLLDPAFVVIDNTGKAFATGDLVDPAPALGNDFGHSIVSLSGGNIVVTAPGTNGNRGAAYLFSGSSGALISTVAGTTAGAASGNSGLGDRVGEEGVVALTNGNFVVQSVFWNNAEGGSTLERAGAVTFGNGTTGFTGGTVTSSNSLVGSHADDLVGNDTVLALTNGNYVVPSSAWLNPGIGSIPDAAGAATWGSGITGVHGVVSASNSLIGIEGVGGIDLTGSEVGQRLVGLANGDYVVGSPQWSHGQGAATYGNGTTGVSGAVSSSNSLIGTNQVTQACPACGDEIGNIITPLSDGNYVVSSAFFNSEAGGVFYVNTASGFNKTGTALVANAFTGNHKAGDALGFDGIGGVVALQNGMYVIVAPQASVNGVEHGGAVTLIKPSGNFSNTTGTPTLANSLVGGNPYDQVGGGTDGISGAFPLTNGNFVVSSSSWGQNFGNPSGTDSSGNNPFGAATFINVASPTVGIVTSSNSLVGTTGGPATINGSPNPHFSSFGGDAIASGGVSLFNSDPNAKGIIALSNGNYLVVSPFYDANPGSSIVYSGAVTLGSGTTGITGTINSSNSLLGSHESDLVGSGGAVALQNGAYAVASPNWANGATLAVGAVTVAPTSAGVFGNVSTLNSFVGSTAGDQVGGGSTGAVAQGQFGPANGANRVGGILALASGNLVVASPFWSSGKGAVTFLSGTTADTGSPSAANSLVGATNGDNLGEGTINGVLAGIGIIVSPVGTGDYAVLSPGFTNGANANAGAVTIGKGTGGTVGTISASNSLIGSRANAGLAAVGFVQSGPNSGALFAGFQTDVGFGSAVANGSVELAIVNPNLLTYAALPGQTVTVVPAFLTSSLDAGANVTIQASKDITINSAVTETAGGAHGSLTLDAGRSIIVNAGITTDNGNLTLTANDPASPDAASTAAAITIGASAAINTGTGDLTIQMLAGANTSGTTSIGSVMTANHILVQSTGAVTLATGGKLAASATTNTAVQVVSGGAFTNSASLGSGAITTGAGGHWLIWSQNPANDTLGGLAFDYKQYNATFGTTTPLGTGNGILYTLAPMLTPTVTGPISKQYDGTNTATVTAGELSATGIVTGDTVTFSLTGATYDNKNAGTGKTVNATGVAIASATTTVGSKPIFGYQLASTTASSAVGTITQAPLTVTANTDSRTYNGTTASAVAPTITGTVFTGDTANFAEAFDSKNVGARTLTPTGAVSDGNGGNNYAVTFHNAAGTITQAPLTVTAVTETKTYDGTTAANVSPTITGTVFSGDTANFSEAFGSKDVKGTNGSTLIASGSVADGNSGNNYAVTFANTTGTITPATLTATATAPNRGYDGTTASSFTITNLATIFGTDQVSTTGGTATFADKNAGNAKVVTVTGLGLTGNDAGDYQLASTTVQTTASISQAAITVTAVTQTKGYDGTTSANTSPNITGTVFTGDTANFSEAYLSKNVLGAGGSTLAPSGSVADGNAGNNYIVTFVNTTGTITAAPLTVTAVTETKGYDGTTTANVSPTVTGTVFAGDTGSFSEAFVSKNVLGAGGSTLTPSGSAADGNSGNNYSITFVNTAGTITQAPLTVTAVTETKGYDGTTAANVSPTVTGTVFSGDTANFSEAFLSKNALGAGGSTLAASGSVTDGNSGNNYHVTFVNTAGTINPALLTVTAVTETKTYDGTTAANVSPTVTGTVFSGDTANFSEAVVSKNVLGAGGSTLTPSGSVADSNSGNNYSVAFVSTAGTISQKSITASLQGVVSKTYDGTTSATLTAANYALPGVIGGDAVTITNTVGTYDTANVGINKTVTVNGLTLGGGSSGNYVLTSMTTSGAVGTILQAPLTITALDESTILGQPLPTFGANISGFVHNESSSVLSGSLAFAVPAAALAQPGIFPIVPGGVTSTNYAITFVDGNLTVTGISSPLPPVPVDLRLPPPDFTLVTTDLNPQFDNGNGNGAANGNGGAANGNAGGANGNGAVNGNGAAKGNPGGPNAGVLQGNWLFFGSSFGEVSDGGSDDKNKGKGNGKGNGNGNANANGNGNTNEGQPSANAQPGANTHG